MNNIEFESTFDEIEYNIAMKMYVRHNDKIAYMYEHLGEMYGYKDLEEAKALEEYDTLQEYKKALKEKCDTFDKAMEYIENNSLFEENKGKDFEYSVANDNKATKELLSILRGEE